MYKKDSYRVEDGIIPMVLESLLLTQMNFKESYRKRFSKYLPLIKADIHDNIHGSRSATKTLLRLDGKVIRHFVGNEWDTRKSCLIMSHIASALNEQGVLQLNANTDKILRTINRWTTRSYLNKSGGAILKNVDKSAAKQAPRVLKLIQDEGYF